MTRKTLQITLLGGMAALAFSSYGSGPSNGGAGNHTGSDSSPANCSTGSGCHTTNSSSTLVVIGLTTIANQPVTSYTPGTTYKVVVTASNSSALPRFGFQASCVKAAATSTQAGTFTTTGSISVRSASGLQLVEHNTPIAALTITGGISAYQASFNWTAPAAGTGTVRFYTTLNAVNFTGSSSGDQANTATPADYNEASSAGVGSVTSAAMSVYPNPATDVLHLKLDGTAGKTCSLQVWDMSGRLVASRQTTVANGEAVADVSRLSPGNYYILALKEGKQYVAPFVKH